MDLIISKFVHLKYAGMQKVKFTDLGLMDYKEAWDYQEEIFNDIIQKKTYNRDIEDEKKHKPITHELLFVEHPHVYTLGKSGAEANLLINEQQLKARNASFFNIYLFS